MFEKKELSILDYLLFFGSLVAALGIGIWQAVKFRKDSSRDMLVVSKGMNIIPITLSLVATYLSAILILGYPAEIYSNGAEWCPVIFAFVLGIPLACVTFVPIFYKLKLTSVNEYFELRYRNKGIRVMGSIFFLVQNLLYMGVALWAPVIAISSVTSMPEWVAVLAAGGICTIYTAVGGLRAVMWTDAFQVLVMLLGLLVVIIYGTVHVGGWSEVWRIASENGRATFFNLSLDPFERHSFFWIMLQTTIGWMLVHGANQSSVQRYSSCKTLNQARLTLLLNVPGVCILVALACYSGFVLFANYVDCDPLKAGIIKSKDQIIPYFVLDKLGAWQGLPGIFMACLFSGALSTLSSGLNSLAAITYEDGIKQTKWGENLSEATAGHVTKVLGIVYGAVSIALAFAAGKLGGVLQVVITVTSVMAAPSLNLFLSSILLPFVNVPGVVSGAMTSLAVSSFLGFGSYADGVPPPKPLPTSVAGCPAEWNLISASPVRALNASFNAFLNTSMVATSPIPGFTGADLFLSTENPTLFAANNATSLRLAAAAVGVVAGDDSWESLGYRKIFRISYLLFMVTGLFIGLVVTVVVSLLTGGYPEDKVDSSLVHGWAITFFRKIPCCRSSSYNNSSRGRSVSEAHLTTSRGSSASYNVELAGTGYAGSMFDDNHVGKKGKQHRGDERFAMSGHLGSFDGLSMAPSRSTLVTTIGDGSSSDLYGGHTSSPRSGTKYSLSKSRF